MGKHKKCFLFVLIVFFICQSNLVSLGNKDILIVSNYPEKLSGPGTILNQTYTNSKIRIMFHHINSYNDNLNFFISVTNTGSDVLELAIAAGVGGPSKDVIYTGHIATKSFLEQYNKDLKIIYIKPQETIKLLNNTIQPTQTVSGVVQILNEEKQAVDILVGVVDDTFPQVSLFKNNLSPLNQYKVATFNETDKYFVYKFNTEYTLGGFQIGSVPYVKDLSQNYELKGNYGVMHHINVTLKNTLPTKQIISFYVFPKKDNSVSRAVFIIDGKIKEVSLLKNERSIATIQKFFDIHLKENESKEITMLTLPQAGCYYPIDVIINSQEAIL